VERIFPGRSKGLFKRRGSRFENGQPNASLTFSASGGLWPLVERAQLSEVVGPAISRLAILGQRHGRWPLATNGTVALEARGFGLE